MSKKFTDLSGKPTTMILLNGDVSNNFLICLSLVLEQCSFQTLSVSLCSRRWLIKTLITDRSEEDVCQWSNWPHMEHLYPATHTRLRGHCRRVSRKIVKARGLEDLSKTVSSAGCNPNTSYELTVAVAARTWSRQSALYHEKKGGFIIHTLNRGAIDRWWLLGNCESVFESKKGCGFGQVGKWGGSRKS